MTGQRGDLREDATLACEQSHLPECYFQARQHALAGHSQDAKEAYEKVLADTQDPRLRAVVYNDIAALCAQAGDVRAARDKLLQAIEGDPSCTVARANLQILGGTVGRTPAENHRVRLAILSGLFNWPSRGGGNVHTIELAIALAKAGIEVHHYYLVYPPWQVGEVNDCPIPSQGISFPENNWSLESIQTRVRETLATAAPDLVLLTDCWSLKPWLAEAISPIPCLMRFDALECLCPLNNLRIIPNDRGSLVACTKHRLATPECCLQCVRDRAGFVGKRHQLERDFSRFESPDHHDLLLRTLGQAKAVLVHNPLIAALIEPHASETHVVPIGVDPETFGQVENLPRQDSREQTRILFAGRTTDTTKGFEVLRAAGRALWSERKDFQIVATGATGPAGEPFLSFEGWQHHTRMPALMATVDLLVAPAVGNEPFGLSVVEAMASGRPVVASRVGGQQFTVVDGLTGLLSRFNDSNDLADKLKTLLDSADLQLSMGRAGRQRFLAEYAWNVVIDRYYRPLLARFSPTTA